MHQPGSRSASLRQLTGSSRGERQKVKVMSGTGPVDMPQVACHASHMAQKISEPRKSPWRRRCIRVTCKELFSGLSCHEIVMCRSFSCSCLKPTTAHQKTVCLCGCSCECVIWRCGAARPDSLLTSERGSYHAGVERADGIQAPHLGAARVVVGSSGQSFPSFSRALSRQTLSPGSGTLLVQSFPDHPRCSASSKGPGWKISPRCALVIR